MRFCPVCSYCLFMEPEGADAGGQVRSLILLCRHCGYTEPMRPQNATDAVILETAVNLTKQRMGSQLNEYTKLDPTLPHLKTIPCPNTECASNADSSLRDILYIKTDAKNLKYQYSCTVCDTQWSS